jgi:hypothetical protein
MFPVRLVGNIPVDGNRKPEKKDWTYTIIEKYFEPLRQTKKFAKPTQKANSKI